MQKVTKNQGQFDGEDPLLQVFLRRIGRWKSQSIRKFKVEDHAACFHNTLEALAFSPGNIYSSIGIRLGEKDAHCISYSCRFYFVYKDFISSFKS